MCGADRVSKHNHQSLEHKKQNPSHKNCNNCRSTKSHVEHKIRNLENQIHRSKYRRDHLKAQTEHEHRLRLERRSKQKVYICHLKNFGSVF